MKDFYDFVTKRIQILHLFILFSTVLVSVFSLSIGLILNLDIFFSALISSPLIIVFLIITSFNRKKHIEKYSKINIEQKSKIGRKKVLTTNKIIKDKNKIINKIIKEDINSEIISLFYREAKLNNDEKIVVKRLFSKISTYEKNLELRKKLI